MHHDTEVESSWNSLRVALTVARSGSIRSAAGSLGVNHATVSRHLARYEQELGARLFERVGTRLELTAEGADAIETAERVEQEILDVERRISGGDLRLEGVIRLALPPGLLGMFTPEISQFSREYPQVTLEVVTGLSMVSLSRRDADVALRIVREPPGDLFGRRLGSVTARAVVSPELAAEYDALPPSQWPWVDWETRFSKFPSARWLKHELGALVVARFGTDRDIADAVRGGLGAGYVLNPSDDLLPVPGAPEFSPSLWILIHQDLRNVARFRTFVRLVGDAIGRRLRE